MWRAELLHPMVVHFPIALLIVGAIAFAGSVARSDRSTWAWLRPAARLMLIVGVVGAWAAVWTGDIADSVVARTLCDPPVAEEHESFGWAVAIMFSVLIASELLLRHVTSPGPRRRAVEAAIGLGLLVGVGLVGYVGHLGAELVYQQGAAVYEPGPTCVGFGD